MRRFLFNGQFELAMKGHGFSRALTRKIVPGFKPLRERGIST
jgi:hypothetical protein